MCVVDCAGHADIAFVFDASSSINANNPNNYQLMKNFMKDIVDRFNKTGPDGTQFAVVTFADRATKQFGLKDYSSKADIKGAIDKVTPSIIGQTAIGDGLEVIITQAVIEVYSETCLNRTSFELKMSSVLADVRGYHVHNAYSWYDGAYEHVWFLQVFGLYRIRFSHVSLY